MFLKVAGGFGLGHHRADLDQAFGPSPGAAAEELHHRFRVHVSLAEGEAGLAQGRVGAAGEVRRAERRMLVDFPLVGGDALVGEHGLVVGQRRVRGRHHALAGEGAGEGGEDVRDLRHTAIVLPRNTFEAVFDEIVDEPGKSTLWRKDGGEAAQRRRIAPHPHIAGLSGVSPCR